MTVEIVEHIKNSDEVGVHVQDADGVCIGLGRQGWVHLTWECVEELQNVLRGTLDSFEKTMVVFCSDGTWVCHGCGRHGSQRNDTITHAPDCPSKDAK